MSEYRGRTSGKVFLPNMTSSFEKPKTNESFLSMRVYLVDTGAWPFFA
jgi:hypothetical protein